MMGCNNRNRLELLLSSYLSLVCSLLPQLLSTLQFGSFSANQVQLMIISWPVSPHSHQTPCLTANPDERANSGLSEGGVPAAILLPAGSLNGGAR